MRYSKDDIKVGGILNRKDLSYKISNVTPDKVTFKLEGNFSVGDHIWDIDHLMRDLNIGWFTINVKTQDYEIF